MVLWFGLRFKLIKGLEFETLESNHCRLLMPITLAGVGREESARTLLTGLESPKVECHNYPPYKLDIRSRFWQRQGPLINFGIGIIVTVITKSQQLWGRFDVEHACVNYCIPSIFEGVLGRDVVGVALFCTCYSLRYASMYKWKECVFVHI